MRTYFNRFEFRMTKEQALECSHQGECYDDVTAALRIPAIRRQFKHIDPADIKAELSEYGAWDDTELSDEIENQKRIIWIAACDIRENSHIHLFVRS